MTPLERIDQFTSELLLPLYVEISNARRLADKGRTVRIVSGARTGDDIADRAIAQAHPGRRHISQLEHTPLVDQPGEWVGHTLLIVEPEELRAAWGDPQAGRFYSSALFRITPGLHVFAEPRTFYWMACNRRLHQFAHRYDHAVANHPIEDVNRGHLINQALAALSGFDIGAFYPVFPWREDGSLVRL